ncbi:hypothetical protein Jiend_53490 [Micromonospora endophytica]|nr:hypothetical protein Jiend_53490 [Micromonospora endophytica]
MAEAGTVEGDGTGAVRPVGGRKDVASSTAKFRMSLGTPSRIHAAYRSKLRGLPLASRS